MGRTPRDAVVERGGQRTAVARPKDRVVAEAVAGQRRTHGGRACRWRGHRSRLGSAIATARLERRPCDAFFIVEDANLRAGNANEPGPEPVPTLVREADAIHVHVVVVHSQLQPGIQVGGKLRLHGCDDCQERGPERAGAPYASVRHHCEINRRRVPDGHTAIHAQVGRRAAHPHVGHLYNFPEGERTCKEREGAGVVELDWSVIDRDRVA